MAACAGCLGGWSGAAPPPEDDVTGTEFVTVVHRQDDDQESLLRKAEAGAAPASCSCRRCAACLVCGAALLPLALLALAYVWAMAFPLPTPVLNAFNVTNASDLVERMPFPTTGPFPGIWWMDQYGNHLDAVPDDYEYYFPYASPEILFTLHDSKIVHIGEEGDRDCYYPVGGGGISEDTTWTYINTNGRGSNFFWPILNPPDPAAYYTAMLFCMVNDSYVVFQNTTDMVYTISKTEWGWSRTNEFFLARANPVQARLQAALQGLFWPPIWGISDVDFTRTFHYPVFQVVDAEGQPTEHFDAFLRFINKRVPCKWSWFSWLGRLHPGLRPYVLGKENYCNEGPGSLLWPPLMDTPPGPPCRPFCDDNSLANATQEVDGNSSANATQETSGNSSANATQEDGTERRTPL